MGYYISLGLDAVKLQAGRAMEAIESLKAYRSGSSFSDAGLQERIAKELARVESGEKTALEVLQGLFEDEDFECEVSDGFLCIESWQGEKSHNEDAFMAGLGHLFEPGGSSWGDGEQGERWEYRFHGGSYELGWAPTGLWVSREDRERVGTAFRQLQGPQEALEAVKAFLMRADVVVGHTDAA